jgi:hypothetical protein
MFEYRGIEMLKEIIESIKAFSEGGGVYQYCSQPFRFEFRTPWRASVQYKGKSHHIGCFNTEVEAAKARDEFISNKG